jgi:hypothetical protein
MNLPSRVVDPALRSKTIQVVEKSSEYPIESQARTGRSEAEEHRHPSFGAVRNLLQSYQQQLSIGSHASTARPARMESSSSQRSSSLSRRATVEPLLKPPSKLNPEFQRNMGLTKELNSPDDARGGQDEVGIWEHLNLLPEDVDDGPEMELMVESERSARDE